MGRSILMTDNEIIKAWDILAKLDFFGGQRAGRELWNEKPVDIQNEDIENFKKDIAFLKEFINRQKAEIERLHRLFVSFTNELCLWIDVNKYDSTGLSIRDMVEKSDNITANIKAEADKEFAKRLRAKAIVCGLDIDYLLKEVVGDNNE